MILKPETIDKLKEIEKSTELENIQLAREGDVFETITINVPANQRWGVLDALNKMGITHIYEAKTHVEEIKMSEIVQQRKPRVQENAHSRELIDIYDCPAPLVEGIINHPQVTAIRTTMPHAPKPGRGL